MSPRPSVAPAYTPFELNPKRAVLAHSAASVPVVNGWLSGGNCLPPLPVHARSSLTEFSAEIQNPSSPLDYTEQGGVSRLPPHTSRSQSEAQYPNAWRHRAADIRQGHFPMRRRVRREMFSYLNRKVISRRHKEAPTNEVKPS